MSQNKIKCLVVDDEPDLCEMIGAYLECTYDADVKFAHNGLEAIIEIDQNPNLEMVICDYNMPKCNGGKVFQHLQKISSKISFIYCSSDPIHVHPEIDSSVVKGIIEKPNILAGIDAFFATPNQRKSSAEAIVPAEQMYAKVKLSMLRKTNVLPCDLYIQLGKTKFVKLMSKDDLFTDEDSLRIYGKKLEYLSVLVTDLDAFFAKVFREFFAIASLIDVLPPTQNEMAALVYIQESIHDLAETYGFSTELQRITKNQVTAVMQVLSPNPGLKSYLDEVMRDPDHYLASHSICLTAVSCDIAERMGWNSEQTLYKLTLAAILHDSTLKNHDLAKCQTNLDLVRESRKFTDEEKESWRKHPAIASHLASRFTEVPPDVDSIILQHHERPDGSGFPNKLTSLHISPLSAVFIVAGDLTHEMFRLQEAFSMKEFIKNRQDFYGSGQFRKILESLDDHTLAATG